MKTQSTNEKDNLQSKVLLIRMWEILRRFGSDRPLSLEDIREILIEDDRARGISEEEILNKDKYNARLLRSNIKAINAALKQLPDKINVSEKEERAELLKRKQKKRAKEEKSCEPIERIIIGRGESKECLYYNSNAFTLDEVRFLHDAVNAQDCLTRECSDEIGSKLINLVGTSDFEPWEYRVVRRPPTCLTVSDVFDVIKKIEVAIKNNKRLSFKYMKGVYDPRGWKWEPGMWSVQEIHPVSIFYNNGRYYLYGFDYPLDYADIKKFEGINRYRTLQIDRMTRVVVTDEPSGHEEDRKKFFEIWRKYKGRVPELLPLTGEASTQVTLRVPYRFRQDVEDKFGSTIELRYSKKKRGCYLFNVDVSSVPELIKWVMGYGGEVEIIKPLSVRKQLAEFWQASRNSFKG